MAEQEAVEAAERGHRGEAEGDVAGQHREAGDGVLALVADGHEWVGRKLGARQRLLVGVAQVAERPLRHLAQRGVLRQHRHHEQRDRRLVDEVELSKCRLLLHAGRSPTDNRR